MDNIVYEWLLSITPINIINYLLIISSNDLYLSYNNLIKYCNNNNQQELYGLNNKQFEILKHYINSTLNKITSSIINTIQINDHNVNNNNNIKSKLDCTIKIIIENNKIINNNNNDKQIIVLPTSSLSTTTTSTIQQKQNRDNNLLFYLIWRNIIIRNEILFHVRLYNIYSIGTLIILQDKLNEFKFKSYINSISIQELSKCDLKSIKLPIDLKEIIFPNFYSKVIPIGFIPNSVTSLEFGDFFQSSLDGGWIPSSVKKIKFGFHFQNSIKCGHLPESLTKLTLSDNYKGIIEYNAIPILARNDFIWNFNSKKNKIKLSDYPIPQYCISLEFDNDFSQDIKFGDIPHNITELKFGYYFNSNIEINAIPSSVRSLTFGSKAVVPFLNGGFTIPSNLTSIDFGSSTSIPRIILPKSITSITTNDNIINEQGFYLQYPNLNTLKFINNVFQTISSNEFPTSLTSLDLGFKHVIDIQLISTFTTLKSLNLGLFFNDVILPGQLPPNLKSLILGQRYMKPISPGVLPNGLQNLTIECQIYNHDLSINDILPKSVQSITISMHNINFINNQNLNFILKFIKLIK